MHAVAHKKTETQAGRAHIIKIWILFAAPCTQRARDPRPLVRYRWRAYHWHLDNLAAHWFLHGIPNCTPQRITLAGLPRQQLSPAGQPLAGKGHSNACRPTKFMRPPVHGLAFSLPAKGHTEAEFLCSIIAYTISNRCAIAR